MKNLKIMYLLLSSIFFLCACNEKSKSSKSTYNLTDSLKTNTTTNTNNSNNKPPINLLNTSGPTFHYICLKGCSGGASSAGNCTSCGSQLAHNAAFHNNTNNSAPFAGPFNTPPAKSNLNVTGVFHYICSNGCAGGSGSAGNCNTCGNTLTHNATYHN